MSSFFGILWWIMLLLYIPAAIALITIVLLQKGKGAGFAGAFGMGSGSDTVFGPRLARTLPQKLTYASAAVFMILALSMSMISGKTSRGVAPELIDESDFSEQQIDQLLEEDIQGTVTVPGAETTTPLTPVVVNQPDAAATEGDTGAEAMPAPDTAATPVEAETPAEDTGVAVDVPVVVEDTPAEETPAPVEEVAPAEEAAPADAASPAESAPEAAAPAEEPAVQ
jgi:protein translocase SecG subunit